MEITPELQQKMVGIVDYLETAIKQSAEFAADQAPEVVQQLLVWNAVSSAIAFAVAVLVGIAIPLGVWKFFRYFHNKNNGSYNEGMEYLAFIPIILELPILIIICENMDWLKIWLAPKLYLLEYASSLLK